MTFKNQTESSAPAFSLRFSRNFGRWLADLGVSLAFTTYQAGKLFMLGTSE